MDWTEEHDKALIGASAKPMLSQEKNKFES